MSLFGTGQINGSRCSVKANTEYPAAEVIRISAWYGTGDTSGSRSYVSLSGTTTRTTPETFTGTITNWCFA
jgi:hypothetical protein